MYSKTPELLNRDAIYPNYPLLSKGGQANKSIQYAIFHFHPAPTTRAATNMTVLAA